MNELDRLVLLFNNRAIAEGWSFGHGFKYDHNQKGNEISNDVGLFLYDVDVLPRKDNNEIGAIHFDRFSGNFFLGMKSTMDLNYYEQENGVKGSEYRHDKHISPLFEKARDMVNQFNMCDSEGASIASMIPYINYLDHNLDGWLVKFTIQLKDV